MSANKAKGSRFEREVVGYLVDHGCPEAGRIVATGLAQDPGDIDGVPGFALQCKNRASIDLAGFVDEANRQAGHKGEPFGAAVVKRRTRGAGDSYVVMDLATFARLLRNAALDQLASDAPGGGFLD